MLPLGDKRWQEFEGGYRLKYDASVPLALLEGGAPPGPVWRELWEELHHQGDVDIASYAAVPHIARIVRARKLFDADPFALVLVIEVGRGRGGNPPLPAWLEESYHAALFGLAEYACENLKEDWDASLLKSVLGLLAVVKGNRDLGELILEVDHGSERRALELFFEG